MKRQKLPPCCSCGACCVAPDDTAGYVWLDRKDALRLSVHTRARHLQPPPGFGNGFEMATKHVHRGGLKFTVCALLRGTPMRRCSCAIYLSRPEACRAFRRGSHQCEYAHLELKHAIEENS